MVHKVVFKLNQLKSLAESTKSCVRVKEKCSRSLTILPIQLANIKFSVRECLDSIIATYDTNLDGIVLSFKGVSILDTTALGDDGEVKVKYVADVYLFRPEIGSILTGIVHKQSEDNIGCLVHKIFNATIPYENQDVWNLSIGQEITFKVVELDYSGQLPFIKGKLLETSMPKIRKDGGVDSGLGASELVASGIQERDRQTYFEANQEIHCTKKKKKHKKGAVDIRSSDIGVHNESTHTYCELDQDLCHPNIVEKKKKKVNSKIRDTTEYVDTILHTDKRKTNNVNRMVPKQDILLEDSNYTSCELSFHGKQDTKDCNLGNIEWKLISELNVPQKRKKGSLKEMSFESVSQFVKPRKNKKKPKLDDKMITKSSGNQSENVKSKSKMFIKDPYSTVAESDQSDSYSETGKNDKSDESVNTISRLIENSLVPFRSAGSSTKQHHKKKNKHNERKEGIDSNDMTTITSKILSDIMAQNKQNKCFKTGKNDNPVCKKSKKEDKQPVLKKSESIKKSNANEEMDLIQSRLLSDVLAKRKQTSYKTEKVNGNFVPNDKEDETPSVKCSADGDNYEVKWQQKKKGKKKSESNIEINVEELAQSKYTVNKPNLNEPRTLQIVEKPSASSIGMTGTQNGPFEQNKMKNNIEIKDDEIGKKKWKIKTEIVREVNIDDIASSKLLTDLATKSKHTYECKEVLSRDNLNALEREIGETQTHSSVEMTGSQNKLSIKKKKKSKRKICEEETNLERVGRKIKGVGETDIDDITSKLLNKVLSKSNEMYVCKEGPNKGNLNTSEPVEITSSRIEDIRNEPSKQKKKKKQRKTNNEDINLDDVASKMTREYL